MHPAIPTALVILAVTCHNPSRGRCVTEQYRTTTPHSGTQRAMKHLLSYRVTELFSRPKPPKNLLAVPWLNHKGALSDPATDFSQPLGLRHALIHGAKSLLQLRPRKALGQEDFILAHSQAAAAPHTGEKGVFSRDGRLSIPAPSPTNRAPWLQGSRTASAILDSSDALRDPRIQAREAGKRTTRSVLRRSRRSRGSEGSLGPMPGLGFAQQRLKWRLMAQGHSDHLTKEEQRRELRLAFRRWSEVAPLSFQEDLTCPMAEIDIWVGFGTRRHLGCPWAFDGLGGELAHTLLPGEIHLDDDEPYNTSPSDQGVGLLQVAVHEIGHVLGLPHLLYPGSVMHPFYPTTGGTVELSWHDRRAIQELYGQCEDPFDTVFDWVRRQSSQKGEPVLRFNTFFFRGGQYWLYENRHSRPRLGDPRRLTAGWRGLPEGGVDAFVHVWTPKIDARFFFKGTQFWRYDSSTDRVFTQDPEGQRYPRRISEGFPGVSGPIDAAVFLRREGRIYFFKGQEVLAFGVSSNQTLPGFPKRLEEVFPASIQEDHPTGNLDAAYYSYTHHTLFLFKDKFFWEVAREGSTEHPMSHNALLPRRRVAEQWLDLCDVHPSTLDER